MSEEFKGLSLVELYEQLEPVEAPAPIAMVPQTAGWVWLGVAVLALLVYGIWRWRTWRKANAYRRAGLESLKLAADDPASIAAVLRRTALAGFPREQVASLYGEAWLAFLDNTSHKNHFSGTPAGQALITAPYRAASNSPELSSKAQRWIKHHKRAAGAS